MSVYLIGVYECKLDAKSRLMLPKAFKKQLAVSLEAPFHVAHQFIGRSLRRCGITPGSMIPEVLSECMVD